MRERLPATANEFLVRTQNNKNHLVHFHVSIVSLSQDVDGRVGKLITRFRVDGEKVGAKCTLPQR